MVKKGFVACVSVMFLVVIGYFIFYQGNEAKSEPVVQESSASKIKEKTSASSTFFTNVKTNDSAEKVEPYVQSEPFIAEPVVSQKEKKIYKFTKENIELMTGLPFAEANIADMSAQLALSEVWQNVGIEKTEADTIAYRFEQSSKKAQGILNGIRENSKKQLKVIYITKYDLIKAKIESE